VSYLASTQGIFLWMDDPSLGTGDSFVSIERIFASNNNDQIWGATDTSESIFGFGGDDILWGGFGAVSDSLFGGTGDDDFLYGIDEGADVIFDFQTASGDVIDFWNDGGAYDTFAEIMAITSQVGNNVIFDFGSGNTLTLVGVDMNELSIDDFVGVNSAESLQAPDTFAGAPIDFDIPAFSLDVDAFI